MALTDLWFVSSGHKSWNLAEKENLLCSYIYHPHLSEYHDKTLRFISSSKKNFLFTKQDTIQDFVTVTILSNCNSLFYCVEVSKSTGECIPVESIGIHPVIVSLQGIINRLISRSSRSPCICPSYSWQGRRCGTCSWGRADNSYLETWISSHVEQDLLLRPLLAPGQPGPGVLAGGWWGRAGGGGGRGRRADSSWRRVRQTDLTHRPISRVLGVRCREVTREKHFWFSI